MALEKINTSICIIGAGPAGTSTSIFLSKLGIKHIIVDSANFPRKKVCGDGLDLKSLRMLNHIDPKIIPNELLNTPDFTPSWGFRIISPKGVNSDFILNPEKGYEKRVPFIVSKRIIFDNFLIKKLDSSTADFRQGTKITSISKEGETWTLKASTADSELTITCKLIVGADGDHSTVLKHLGDRKVNRRHYIGSVRQYWKNVSGMSNHNLLEIYYPKNLPMSYFWIFPLSNGEANVGYAITNEIAKNFNLNIRETFKEIIEKDPAISHRFKDATPIAELEGMGIPVASLQRKVVGNGWILVGDAASMASPTSGEGIGTGMMTGYIAAKFIEKGIKANDFSEVVIGNYSREIFKRMKLEIRNYNLSLKYPFIANLVANYLIGNNFISRFIVNYKFRGLLKTCYEKEVEVELE